MQATPFEIWDVFSGQRLLGNPLAVFPDARKIAESQFGAIAREMAHSETTFVFPRAAALERTEGVRTRIFSRFGTEMPFAGHPVLGTAFALWGRNRRRTDGDGKGIRLSLPAGIIPVVFRESEGSWEGEMTQPDPIFAERHEPELFAPLLGLRPEEVNPAAPVENVSTGRPNVLVLLHSLGSLRRAVVDWRALDAYFSTGDPERGVYLVTREVEVSRAQFHARKVGRAGDDPVTGSAAGCAIAWLVKHGLAPADERVVIEQGSEVQRRGELAVCAARQGDRILRVRVAGQAVRSAVGMLELPKG